MKFAVMNVALAGLASTAMGAITPMVGYTPVEDVSEHAKIDLDMADFSKYLKAEMWSEAEEIYKTGNYSSKGDDVFRTIQGFSTGLVSKAKALKEKKDSYLSEYFLFVKYYGDSETYGDDLVLDNINAEGKYANLGEPGRIQLALKGAQYQIVWMYVLRELYEALASCEVSNEAKPKAWDEGVAFYAGSLAVTAETEGQLLYTLAQKRSVAFETYSKTTGEANANIEALKAFDEGLAAVQANDCVKIEENILKVRKQMQIPLIQGALYYGQKSDPALIKDEDKDDHLKWKAEAAAFAAGVLPFINEVDPKNAEILEKNLVLNDDTEATFMQDGTEQVATAIYKTLEKLCISCEEIGVNNLKVEGYEFPLCTTDTVALKDCDYLSVQDSNALIYGLLGGCVVVLVAIVAGIWYMSKGDDAEVEAEDNKA